MGWGSYIYTTTNISSVNRPEFQYQVNGYLEEISSTFIRPFLEWKTIGKLQLEAARLVTGETKLSSFQKLSAPVLRIDSLQNYKNIKRFCEKALFLYFIYIYLTMYC